jgi:hypothetical protein
MKRITTQQWDRENDEIVTVVEYQQWDCDSNWMWEQWNRETNVIVTVMGL